MRSLCRGPEREFATDGIGRHGFPVGNAGMGLDGRVIVAFVVKPVFAHIVCLRETSINFAKFIGDGLVNIADTRFIVDFDVGVR